MASHEHLQQGRLLYVAEINRITFDGSVLAIDPQTLGVVAVIPAGPGAIAITTPPQLSPPPTNMPPVAAAGADITVLVGETAVFDGSASQDPDGIVTDFQWDFGDGTAASGATANHVYAAAGVYTATLTVTDDKGATAIDTVLVTVLTPAQAIQSISGAVQSLNIAQGISNSLDAKLQNAADAINALNSGNRQDAVNKLQAFINSVEAQRGKELTDAQADALISAARRVLGVI